MVDGVGRWSIFRRWFTGESENERLERVQTIVLGCKRGFITARDYWRCFNVCCVCTSE